MVQVLHGSSRSSTATAARPDDLRSIAGWDRWADGLPSLQVEAQRVVVVAPHPGDETLGCGGLVASLAAREASVHIVTATDGAASHPGSAGLVCRRHAEQISATAALGCRRAPTWLGLPDGHLASYEGVLRAHLVDAVTGADLLIAPWTGDGVSDHAVAGRVAAEVAARDGIRLLAYPMWVLRWGAPADLASLGGRRVDLDAADLVAKRAASMCFPSQTTQLVGAVSVDDDLLCRLTRPHEVYLEAGVVDVTES